MVHNGSDWQSDPLWQSDLHTVYRGDDGYIGMTKDFATRKAYWASQGRHIEPLYENIPGRLAAHGVEQSAIESTRAAGTGVDQINSIDPARTDPKALEMRARGADYLNKSPGC